MAPELRQDILSALRRHHNERPGSYTYVSTLLSDLGIPYDINVGNVFHSLQSEGLIEVIASTNVRIRLTPQGISSLG